MLDTRVRVGAVCFVGVLVAVACGGSPPQPLSLRVLPRAADQPANDRAKYVEVCFARALERHEEYDMKLDLVTMEGRKLSCDGVLVDSFGEQPNACKKWNAYVYCLTARRPKPEDELTVDEFVKPGNIRSATVMLTSTTTHKLLSTTTVAMK
jgi:hypothetical protein